MERRDLDLRDFDEILAEIDQLHEQGYTPVGEWDLAATCRHLAAPVVGSMEGFPFAASWLMRKMARLVAWKSVFVNRQIKQGIKAPASVVFETAENAQPAIDELRKAIDKYRRFEGEKQPHPFFGKLTDDEWDTFHQTHMCHHLRMLIPKG